MSPSPRTIHQLVSVRLSSRLHVHVETHNLGLVLEAPMDVVFSRINVVQPDIIFIAKARLHIVTPENIRGAPDLLVEILSPTTADIDRDIKRKLYARFGVKEYWLVNTDKQRVEVYRARRRQFPSRPIVARHTLESPLLSGLRIPLPEIWRQP